MFMLKANAYGHGLIEVAKHVENVVDAFGVEVLEEGVALRNAGIQNDILVLACASDEIECAHQNSLTIGLHDISQINALKSLKNEGKVNAESVKLHLKIDSGMHRLGFDVNKCDEVLCNLKNLGYKLDGIYSHIGGKGNCQKSDFDVALAIARKYYPSCIAHLASSRHMRSKDLQYDMVRVGIDAYNGAMSAQSTVLDARFVRDGELVGYGDFSLEKDSNVAVIFGGYADGISRENVTGAYLQGKLCRAVGNACMDVFVVDTGDYKAQIGESVLLFDKNTIDHVAKCQNTITYNLLTSLHGRVKRCYHAKG